MNLNIWIVLSTQAKNAVNARLRHTDGEYTGPVSDQEYNIFRRMVHHSANIDRWTSATFGGKTWTLFNLTFADPDKQLKKALDYLADNRGNSFRIGGCWWWDGRQVGTQWDEETGNVVGTPIYPIPEQLIQFMPDDVDYTDPENPVFTPATELKQVNLEQGQHDRRFT